MSTRWMAVPRLWVTLVVVLVLAGGSLPSLAQQPTRLKLGIVTALSGPLAAPGKFQQNGFAMAVEEINAAGGVRIGGTTYTLELVTYDTKGVPTEGASAVLRLATVDKVPAILGELSSAVALAEGPVARDHRVPIIFTVPTAPSVTEQKNPFMFRVNAHNNMLNVDLAQFIVEQRWSPVAFIGWNNDAGRLGIAHMTSLLRMNGVQIGASEYFNLGETNFTPLLTNIKASNPRALMMFADEEPGSLIMEQALQLGLRVQLIGTLAMGSNRMLRYIPKEKLAGMIQYNAFPPNAPLPRIRTFATQYTRKYNEEAHGFAAQSYDGLRVAVEAMKAAQTTTDTVKIRDALAKTRYTGVIGLIEFDEKGQARPPVYVTQWCPDGNRRILAPTPGPCGSG